MSPCRVLVLLSLFVACLGPSCLRFFLALVYRFCFDSCVLRLYRSHLVSVPISISILRRRPPAMRPSNPPPLSWCRTYVLRLFHLCSTAHKKKVISPIFCTNLRLEAPLPVCFSCTFRRSATTSATLLIPKCTTGRWTLRCSNYSVAKRQQFSCVLSTATLSLKFENVVPEGWI